MNLYTASSFAEVTGISYRQIDYWVRQGYLKPLAINGAKDVGTGNVRVFSDAEVLKARLMKALINPAGAADLAGRLLLERTVDVGCGMTLTLATEATS